MAIQNDKYLLLCGTQSVRNLRSDSKLESNVFVSFKPLNLHSQFFTNIEFPVETQKLCNVELEPQQISLKMRVLTYAFSHSSAAIYILFVQAIVASSYIPAYMGLDFPTYMGEVSVYLLFRNQIFNYSFLFLFQKCVDGGLTNNLPYADEMHTITVSPFSGDFDICPMDPHKGRYNAGCFHMFGHK